MVNENIRSTSDRLAEFGTLIHRLQSITPLTDDDIVVLRGSRILHHPAGTEIFSEGDSIDEILFIDHGWAYRYRLLADGRKQIVNFVLPGDLLGPITPTAKQFSMSINAMSVLAVPRIDIADTTRAQPNLHVAIEALFASECEVMLSVSAGETRKNEWRICFSNFMSG